MVFQLLMQQGCTSPVMFKKFCYALTMLVSLFAASANGDYMAYSVNSDSPDGDRLYLINLENGSSTARPFPLLSVAFSPNDVEGLAFDSNGTLWGIDDGAIRGYQYPTLFPINTSSGSGNSSNLISFNSLPSGGANDFGMTFACDNTLYVTSVTKRTLYELDFEGNAQVVGSVGALNADISAIAAIGNPTRLYGLGNGDESASLYSIDVSTGIATIIGPLGAVGEYSEGGMDFDSEGVLWAITDRSLLSQNSQVLRINLDTGAAEVVSSTLNEIGFESLAIGPPTDCDIKVYDEYDDPRIPSLNLVGRLLAVIILMFTGMAILRRRIS